MKISFNAGTKQISFDPPKKAARFRFDLSTISLLLSNVIVIGVALWEEWEVAALMWIYWGQSVVIGSTCFVKMWNLKSFTTDGLKVNRETVQPNRRTQRRLSYIFLFHYGAFHLAYFLFLFKLRPLAADAFIGTCGCVLIFAAHHVLQLWRSWNEEVNTLQNIGHVMFASYPRIFPIHLTIISGSFLIGSTGTLLLFLGLKVAVDVAMEMKEQTVPVEGKTTPESGQ